MSAFEIASGCSVALMLAAAGILILNRAKSYVVAVVLLALGRAQFIAMSLFGWQFHAAGVLQRNPEPLWQPVSSFGLFVYLLQFVAFVTVGPWLPRRYSLTAALLAVGLTVLYAVPDSVAEGLILNEHPELPVSLVDGTLQRCLYITVWDLVHYSHVELLVMWAWLYSYRRRATNDAQQIAAADRLQLHSFTSTTTP